MYSFLVLGLIPGTAIQITYRIWVDCILLAVEVAALRWLYRRHPDVKYRLALIEIRRYAYVGLNATLNMAQQLKIHYLEVNSY
jgi:hypothetical protein